jgi:hypothetical protein
VVGSLVVTEGIRAQLSEPGFERPVYRHEMPSEEAGGSPLAGEMVALAETVDVSEARCADLERKLDALLTPEAQLEAVKVTSEPGPQRAPLVAEIERQRLRLAWSNHRLAQLLDRLAL